MEAESQHDEGEAAAMLFGGVRVLDLGTMIGGPFAATLMGDFGAEVIKVEHPLKGDPVRQLLPHKDGVPLWWKVLARNKKSVTIDLSRERGRTLFLKLVADADVIVESFRPGTLERWGLGWETLRAVNPALVLLRISGFGQTGPLRDRPGFGRFAEAFSGLAQLTGSPDGPPTHAGVPLADYITGLMGWGAVASALYRRETSTPRVGQCIDLALYESVFRMLEFLVVETDQLGTVRNRMGNENAYVAPVNTYRCSDGTWVSFTASTQRIVERLFDAIGRPELRDEPRFRTNADRVDNRAELDEVLTAWFTARTPQEIEETFDRHAVPFAPILDAAGILSDPHYAAREAIVRVPDQELGEIAMPGVVPKFSATPGAVRWAGVARGEHNREVFAHSLRLCDSELRELEAEGVI